MNNDEKIARKAIDLTARAKDYRMSDIPGYTAWSERKLEESDDSIEALIAHLDATSVWCLPEALSQYTEKDFDEMLENVREELE